MSLNITKEEAAYAAALLDMKGSFSINEMYRKRKRGNVGTYAAHLFVTTTSPIVEQFFKSKFAAQSVRNNGSFRIYWNYEEMMDICQAVQPHMKVRKAQVDLLMEFLRSTGEPGYQSNKMKELNEAVDLQHAKYAPEDQVRIVGERHQLPLGIDASPESANVGPAPIQPVPQTFNDSKYGLKTDFGKRLAARLRITPPVVSQTTTVADRPHQSQANFCTACGTRTLPEARFCASCGKPIG